MAIGVAQIESREDREFRSRLKGLSASFNFSQAGRQELVRRARDLIGEEKAKIRAEHERGAGGIRIATRSALLVDVVLKEIYNLAAASCARKIGKFQPTFAVVAVGGYGRGELNPFSDLDVMFLYDKKPDQYLDAVVTEILTFLWDIGFEVGHSSRSIANCIKIASSDLTAKTALMEARFLQGNARVFHSFAAAFKRHVLGKGVNTFIEQKLRERENRYAQYGEAPNLLEPNIKESSGGLRDFHMAMWTALARFGFRYPDDLHRQGLIGRDDLEEVTEAYDFLMRVRNDLHFLSGRKFDHLVLQIQGEVARRLRYEDDEKQLGVEYFMKDYYVQANAIHHYSRMVLERCREPSRLFNMVQRVLRQKEVEPGIYLFRGELRIPEESRNILVENPLLLLRIFQHCQKHRAQLSEDVKRLIHSHLWLIDGAFQSSSEAREIFVGILKNHGYSETLRLMHETGVLGGYIPEFAAIICHMQYDLYHRYTVDEHTLLALKVLDDLGTAEEPELKELATIYRGLENRLPLQMAVLFHDVGKGRGGGHTAHSMKMAREAMERMGFSSRLIEQVQLLVENHLLMNYTAQRRDINEKKVIAEFAKTVSTVENLRLLYLITYADLRAVGPDVWTIWKGALLWEIYHKALDVLEGAEEEETSIEEQVARIKEEVVLRLAPEVGREAVEDFFRAMPYKYILSMPAETITRHVRLTTSLGDDKLRIHYTHNDEVRYSELMVSTIGKAGVFSKIAGTLTSKNINILGAQIYTRNDGIAVDTLQVESLERTPIYDERVWESIRKDLLAILEGEKQVEDLLANRQRSGPFRREPAIAVPVRIELDNRTSDTHTVIEVICPDLMGNLYRITNVLYHLGIDIYLAKISTEADRAINVFYVTDLAGMKIVGEEKIQPLREEIRAALMPSPA